MAVRVSPTEQRPTAHVSLTDHSSVSIGLILSDTRGNPNQNGLTQSGTPRTSMRIATGQSTYWDLEPPYTPIIQSDFIGGRGGEDFESDRSRYGDNNRIDTNKGDVILGPKDHATTGYYSSIVFGAKDGELTLTSTGGTTERVASSYANGGTSFLLRRITVQLSFADTASHSVTIKIYSDSSGPNAELYTVTRNITAEEESTFQLFEFDVLYTLAASTTYWFSIEISSGTLQYATTTAATTKTIYSKSGAGAWSSLSSSAAIAFSLYTNSNGQAMFFSYKNCQYMVTRSDDQTAPKIYRNGYRGAATSNSANKALLNSGLTLVENELVGCIALITKGLGVTEEQRWRLITGNTVGGAITCYPEWKITHDTTTEFVILGSDKWNLVDTTKYAALKYPPTAVCIVDEIVYFAQGEAYADSYIVRYREYNNAGTWTVDTAAADGTNKAEFLAFHTSTRKIYKANNVSNPSFAIGSAVVWPNNVTYATAVNAGNFDSRITGLVVYGNPQNVWVMKEDAFAQIDSSSNYIEIPLSEMRSVKSEFTGKATLQHNVYLYFSLLDGLERYIDAHLDDVGPNIDEGLPAGRQGNVAKLIGYPGRFYAAVDAGRDSYSSILCYNGTGWTEIYRGPVNKRIKDLAIQTIPGTTIDRLWFCQEEECLWLPIAMNPRKSSTYSYTSSGSLITCWMYGNMQDIVKFFNTIKVFSENLSVGHQYITIEYQVDDEDTWNFISANVTVSPIQEIAISNDYDVSGRRIRFRITLYTDDETVSPRLKIVVVEAVTRVPVKNVWELTFLAEDAQKMLDGSQSSLSALELLTQLATWADSRSSPLPLTLASNHSLFNAKRVFVDPVSIQPLSQITTKNRQIKLIGKVTLIEA